MNKKMPHDVMKRMSTQWWSTKQTITSHLQSNCTVNAYGVIHFLDSMWSFWVESNLCKFCIVYWYLCYRWRSNMMVNKTNYHLSPPIKRPRHMSFCTFSFGHCVVCSSSIYGFWLPLWYVLSGIESVQILYRVLISVLPLEIQLSTGERYDPDPFNPAPFVCLSPARTCMSDVIRRVWRYQRGNQNPYCLLARW
jgi:hypothetical protein